MKNRTEAGTARAIQKAIYNLPAWLPIETLLAKVAEFGPEAVSDDENLFLLAFFLYVELLDRSSKFGPYSEATHLVRNLEQMMISMKVENAYLPSLVIQS